MVQTTSKLATETNPGRKIGILGFVFSFFVVLSFAGLILSIVALVRSSAVHSKNGLAIAGIVLSAVNIIVVTPFVAAFAIPIAITFSDATNALNVCKQHGNSGTVIVDATTYNCSPFKEMTTTGN